MPLKFFDHLLGCSKERAKRKPVLIAYHIGKKKFEKKPDDEDKKLLTKIELLSFPSNFPSIEFPFDDMWEAPRIRNRGVLSRSPYVPIPISPYHKRYMEKNRGYRK